MKTWITYLLVSGVTGSPLLGVLVVAALWFGGTSYWIGRLPDPFGPFKRWSRVRHLRNELGMNPQNVNVRTELGGLLAGRSPAEAREVLQDVVTRCPDLPLPMYHLGVAQLAAGDTAAGHALIDRALGLKKDLRFGEPLVCLGDHYLKLGKAEDAKAAYTRATQVHSSFAEAWYKLGKACRALGDAAGAKTAFQTTLSSTEHSPPFKRRIDRSWRIRAWLALRSG